MTAAIDLHIHTTASEDGHTPPAEVFALAKKLGLETIAFTDHDTTAAVHEGLSLASRYGIDFLTGIEMTATCNNVDVHILGYFIDPDDAGLLSTCKATRDSRVGQAADRVRMMRSLGFDIDFDRVMAVAAGRPPTSSIIMEVLRESFRKKPDRRLAPYIDGAKSASPGLSLFLDYFTPGKPAYVGVDTIDSADAVGVIRRAGGLPVLAHPGRLAMEIVDKVLTQGFEGIEVFSTNHTPEDERFYLDMARKCGLVVTAGSDFHGPGRKTAPLGGVRAGGVLMVDALRERHARILG